MLRRTFTITAVGIMLAGGALTGCKTGSTDAEDAPSAATSAQADAFPVTIKHVYGSTTIKAEPTRIAAIGTQDADNLLALGVVPVGATKISWGGNDHGTTAWYDARLKKLGAATQPTLYDDSDGIDFDGIAKSNPDLILATNSGITKAEYTKLTKIAPVVAYPGGAWLTSWQDSLEMDGKAIGRSALATQVEQETTDALTKATEKYPQIKGKTFIWASLNAADLSSVAYYTPLDARPQLLTELGMVNAPIIEKLSKKGQFYSSVSAERFADLKSDVLISYVAGAKDAEKYRKDALVGKIPAIKSGHLVTFPAGQVALSGTVPDPLSVPYAVKHFVPAIAAGIDGK